MLLHIQKFEEMILELSASNNPDQRPELIFDYLNLEQRYDRIAKNTRYIFS